MLVEVGAEQCLMLTGDPRLLAPPDVLNRLRAAGEEVVTSGDDPLMARIRALYEHAGDAADAAWKDLTFADLAQGHADDDAAESPAARRVPPRAS